jgi:Tfp pilus assembly protein FimT
MATPLLLALAALLVLIAVPASRDMFNAMRERNERDAKARMIPVRIDDDQQRRR